MAASCSWDRPVLARRKTAPTLRRPEDSKGKIAIANGRTEEARGQRLEAGTPQPPTFNLVQPPIMTRKAIVSAAFATAVLGVALVASQSASPSSRSTSLPRTVDGRPDLQAVWNFSSLT